MDELTELAAGPLLFGSQQISRRQMHEAVVFDQIPALCALARPGPAQNKDHRHVLGRERREPLWGGGKAGVVLRRGQRWSHCS